MNLPNLLTTIRFVSVFPLLVLLNSPIRGRFRYALAIFCLSMLTDVFDGYFARKFEQVTDFGKFYDAVVDKIVIYSVLFSLYFTGAFEYYVIFPMFIRDMVVDSLRSFALRDDLIIGANRFGKLKFLFQIISAIIALLYLDLFSNDAAVFFVLTNGILGAAFLVSLGGLKVVYFQAKSQNEEH